MRSASIKMRVSVGVISRTPVTIHFQVSRCTVTLSSCAVAVVLHRPRCTVAVSVPALIESTFFCRAVLHVQVIPCTNQADIARVHDEARRGVVDSAIKRSEFERPVLRLQFRMVEVKHIARLHFDAVVH